MLRSWKLGSPFGIGVYVHWTFLLLLGVVFFTNLGGSPGAALSATAMLVAVFGCVVLHELGHALTARAYGIPTRDITLYPIGGVARLERLTDRPVEEFWIALAGPAVNVAIAAALAILLNLDGVPLAAGSLLRLMGQGDFLATLLIANAGLALFNLLPAFPMDGGRILRAVLAHFQGQLRATRIAAGLGVAVAGLILLYGIMQGALMPVLVALFVFVAGQQELAAVEARNAAAAEEPIELLPADMAVYDGAGLRDGRGFSGFTWDARAHLWVEWRNGRPVQRFFLE
jgi:Zn-dependent protease